MLYNTVNTETYRHPLDCFFAPRAVAVIGASERPDTVGRTIFWNLISSPFGGSLYAVNPHHPRVLGIRALPAVSTVPEPVDLAMVITAAPTVPGILDECIEAGVPAAIIISAGFSEQGESGSALQQEISRRSDRIRIIGPNSLGIMNPVRGLNAAYASRIALKGNVGFISQSGAMSASILDWSLQVKTGFSAFVSFGAMVDVGWSDMIYYLGNDPNTKSILMYMESLGDARSFLSAAREVALTKPIIVLKTEQTGVGAQAARTSAYFSAMDTADDDVLSAALLRSGVLRVESIDTLFSMAEVLDKQPRPKGPRLTIISNAAGPAVLATDALVKEGGALAHLSDNTMGALNEALPHYWNRNNPVDIIADADPQRYVKAIECVRDDENSDGLLVLLAPQVTTDPTGTARAIADISDFGHKPVLASWMGGEKVAPGISILNDKGIPAFLYPDQAARIFAAMWQYSYAVRGLYETPEPCCDAVDAGQRQVATDIINAARDADQVILTEKETKEILIAYGIDVAPSTVVHAEEEAVQAAESIGYPIALKFNRRLVGGGGNSAEVTVALVNRQEVVERFRSMAAAPGGIAEAGMIVRPYIRTEGYQLIVGASVDPQFGPYIIFRAGGHTGAPMRDQAYALPPLNTTLARRTMERTRIYDALRGANGSLQVNVSQLEQVLVRLSNLVVAERGIRDIEINPLFVTRDQAIAVNARAVIYERGMPPSDIPQPAIRPYPVEYCTTCALKDAEEIVLRPIRPEDERLMVKFHRTLSSDTVYFRYLHLLSLDQLIRHDRMSQMCFVDYDRQIGLVAVHTDIRSGEQSILAIARLVRIDEADDADFAVVVNDQMQGRGLGDKLMRHLLKVATAERIRRVLGSIHPENNVMLHLCTKLGFKLSKPVGDEVQAEYDTGVRR